MAIPARHVVAVAPEHLLRAGHHVLQQLVQRVPDVDVAVGIGRAVVQQEFRAPLGGRAQLGVEADLLPTLQNLDFLDGQAGPHGKVRLRQEQRRRIIGVRGHSGVALLVLHEDEPSLGRAAPN